MRLASVALLGALALAAAADLDTKRKERPEERRKAVPTSSRPVDEEKGGGGGKSKSGGRETKGLPKAREAKGGAREAKGGGAPPRPPPSAWGALACHGGASLLLLCLLLHSTILHPLLRPLLSHAAHDGEEEELGAPYMRALAGLGLVGGGESLAHFVIPVPWLSVGLVIMVSVLFTINPVTPSPSSKAAVPLNMGTVPLFAVLWLVLVRILDWSDFVRALYGTDSLRPYHLVVMFLGSVYLCTALERSGFLHTAAVKVVSKYGRSPWGLFWALGCFSATLTVLIPDDIVTMTLTPITIRMCQLLNLPEIPFLFSQFFAGNIWAVTLVTGNPTNVLLAEDMGDTFVTFAARMGWPGVAAGLTSFVLMYLTNRKKVDVEQKADHANSDRELGRLADTASGASDDHSRSPDDSQAFSRHGIFCLIRVIAATAFCALEAFHGLPVYLVVLVMGAASLLVDAAIDCEQARDVLRHMPWELFSFVTGFLVLAEAMSICGLSLWLASVFLPLAASRDVAYISGFVTMLFCNIFETLPATLIVFKMIDSVPAWSPAAIAASGALAPFYRDARRAALSAVIFGSNFGANTACIGSLGGLMMRRLAALQGVTVTNSMLLKQGIPVMIPTMFVACFCLIHQKEL
ncbi:hypothetical protein AB1Y20_013777 [Prymnesium parvum]|uniref:Citrate transporter-like domain-containing protein n=1 Tax=Prymnesium parvum TaxID=97485 RepID=A0AB34IHE5_PRYPA